MDTKSHHDLLIERACQDGWTRGHAWQPALRQASQQAARWRGQLRSFEEDLPTAIPRPDAWRIVADDGFLIVEFLEIEVTSGITTGKDRQYRWLWDIFDASEVFGLHIWHMDRFGVIRPYITTSSYAPLVFGMDAGQRS